MKILSIGIVALLIFLAVSSGITKVLLMQQDVEFFGAYGFTNPILIGYGIMQIVGGLFMLLRKTRFLGAALVAITFAVSLVLLTLEGDIPMSVVTCLVMTLLIVVMKVSWKKQ